MVDEWEAEIRLDETGARALIKQRFPTLQTSSLRLVGSGWDNVVWATPEGIAFRFPRRQIAIAGIEREIALLPRLAPLLPHPIPDAAYIGGPSPLFPWPWFGSHLIEGREIAHTRLDDAQRDALARELGSFLRTLHRLPVTSPAPIDLSSLPVDPLGRADMSIRVPKTRQALGVIDALWSAPAMVDQLLDQAQLLPAASTQVLAHGDLHVRHLLLDDRGSLSGVIDWGDVCRADPAVDLSLYWSLFTAPARTAFLDEYGQIDQYALLRARVLGLFLCATLAHYARRQSIPALEREAIDGLKRTVD